MELRILALECSAIRLYILRIDLLSRQCYTEILMKPEQLLAALMLVSLTLGTGLQVDRDHLKAILKNVGLLGRALLAKFIIVPALHSHEF